MKRFRSGKRGQFVIVAALLISLLTLSLAVSIHQMNLHRQELRYKPVQELVLGIMSDLERALTRALAIASQRYYFSNRSATQALNASGQGNTFISKWVRAVLTSFSNLGLNISTAVGADSFSFDSWSTNVGRSQVRVDFDLDINAYGFKGWAGRSAKYVMLRILSESGNPEISERVLDFQIAQSTLSEDQGIPIPNLTNESLMISTIVTGNFPVPARVIDLAYLGGGNYTAKFEPQISGHTLGVVLTVITPEDEIYVSASYRYEDVIVTLQSQDDLSSVPTNLGLISLGEPTYSLPSNVSAQPGTYLLEYKPENSSYSFLNWTTTGGISVSSPYLGTTAVTIDGNGTITAFYRREIPPESAFAFLTLDSREWDYSTPHMGIISLNYTDHGLPDYVQTTVGDIYIMRYVPPDSSYVFLWWDTSADVIPSSSNDNPTILAIRGNGTVTAVYSVEPPNPAEANVTLQSKEENLASTNRGSIQLGADLFQLPSSTTVLTGTYLLEYLPAEGYHFLNWTATGDIRAEKVYSSLTSVTVSGDGAITAFYAYEAPAEPASVRLDSREDSDLTRSLGSVTFGTADYYLPADVTRPLGNYVLEYKPSNESYFFIEWECTGDVIALDSSGNPTTLTVVGDGSVTAIYGLEPPTRAPLSLTFLSREETLASTNLGTIRFGAQAFSLPQWTTAFSGTYLLEYLAVEGFGFVNWTVTGGAVVGDSGSSLTSVTVSGDATITAFYRGCDISLSSREWNNTSFNLGNIVLGSGSYALPAYVIGFAGGDYAVQYVPPGSAYVFLQWEASGAVIPLNSTSEATRLRILGDGGITAVYVSKPELPTEVSISLRSLEESSASRDLGQIQFGGSLFGLPNSTRALGGTYLLEYLAVEGFGFVNWTVTGGAVVGDSGSSLTSVTVSGDATITAFYRGCDISLSSREWNNPSFNLGSITLGETTYSLPNYVAGLAAGDHLLQYTVFNSSYVFLWWECSGGAVAWNGTSANTTVMVYDDGKVMAVYGMASVPPPPIVGDWSVLYVDSKYKIVPGFMWSGKNGHMTSRASTGHDKQEAVMASPVTPTLYLAELVNVTAYVRPVPPNSAKDVYLEVGFNYSGQYYKIGGGTFPANSQGMYRLTIDIQHGNFTREYGVGVIPEGSVVIMAVIVTFYVPPNGFFFLYYGPNDPSRIELF